MQVQLRYTMGGVQEKEEKITTVCPATGFDSWFLSKDVFGEVWQLWRVWERCLVLHGEGPRNNCTAECVCCDPELAVRKPIARNKRLWGSQNAVRVSRVVSRARGWLFLVAFVRNEKCLGFCHGCLERRRPRLVCIERKGGLVLLERN
jgi:hypothetical protein